jgi:glutamate 5-kinase
MLTRESLGKARRIVVKVGTSTLTHDTGKLNFFRIEKLVRELADLANQGKEIILVTSGAVGAGVDRLGLPEKPKTIPGKQAAAAVGQGILMHTYEKIFGEYGQIVAQVLLTREDSVNRKRYANSRNTLLTLLSMKVIPIINENDAVAVDELKIGDNDTLSAMVASIVEADLLVILSDVEGVYTDNPQTIIAKDHTQLAKYPIDGSINNGTPMAIASPCFQSIVLSSTLGSQITLTHCSAWPQSIPSSGISPVSPAFFSSLIVNPL